ncbi:GNAT family N-acetyltransferase [Pedosphaera parvula]|uniref:GCN5-related N-acetyltransferase n=1 Tax=Pedosphaera parvula (strain Ellin514) TaxID=320771 RepID=B9XKK6_PEDPL|nr:GNAT family N-acetyltransferase [Pedosphaera parvula]EEF59676.1 GCN5-related N-acetyltransferase [Pedosphaera parvula Ellin514]
MQNIEEARIGAELMAGSEPWLTLRRDFKHAYNLLTDPSMEVYIGRVGGDVVGFVMVNMQGAFAGYIRALAVMPEWRSQGVGRQLLQYAEKRIFRESPNVFLCVSSFNPRAQAFYHRLDYECIGELKNYVIMGASEMLMRKTIGPKEAFLPVS